MAQAAAGSAAAAAAAPVPLKVDRSELAVVKQEGIREWRRWQQSLEELGEQQWS